MRKIKCATAIALGLCCALQLNAQQLMVGTADIDITPPLPTALQGQMYERIAHSIESPVTANALAIESLSGGTPVDTAVFVACDLTFITSDLSRAVRLEVGKRLPGFNTLKVILTAIHTHTSPVYGKSPGSEHLKGKGTTPKEYFEILTTRLANVVERSWKNRQPASVSWGLGHAVVANNRRASYANGKSVMYGNTNTPGFTNIEGYEDHDVNALFFKNKKGKLFAVAVEVPCPSQEVENHTAVNADYWHEVRVALRKRWGQDLGVIGWAGASGDQSPHLMYRSAAENRMIELAGRTRLQEIGHRVDQALAETYELVKNDNHSDVTFTHLVDSLVVPKRQVTESEYHDAKQIVDSLSTRLQGHPEEREKFSHQLNWQKEVVDRYDQQQLEGTGTVGTEVHAIRIGDIVIATDEFELFTDYGIEVQARSPALQTFVVQLAVGYYIYLPTEKAVKGGGYSAIIQSNIVGPQGGKMLVEKSLEMINKLFGK